MDIELNIGYNIFKRDWEIMSLYLMKGNNREHDLHKKGKKEKIKRIEI